MGAPAGGSAQTRRIETVMKDMPEAVEKMYHDLLMSRTPAERVHMACSMHAIARADIRTVGLSLTQAF